MTNRSMYLGFFLAVAAAAGFSGCANTQVQNQESLLSAAGFGSRTPSTEAQFAMYNRLVPYKLDRSTITGQALYTYADKQKGVVYIGGDQAYQRYSQLALQQSIAEKEREASYSNYLESINKNHSLNYD